MKGIIYKYTSPENKSYIGQTVKSLEQRARNNGSGYAKCPIFYDAILTFGWVNFNCEILTEITEEDSTILQEKLNYWETYYIHLYNTMAPNGYNIGSGGQQGTSALISKAHIQGSAHPNWRGDINDELIIQLYTEQSLTLKEIANQLQLAPTTIKRHLADYGLLREKKYNQAIVQMDSNGNILRHWKSASAAGRELGINPSAISKACKEHRRPYKGITYRYEGEKL